MNYKLGKLQPKIDNRTLKMAMLFKDRAIPPTPEKFDVDADGLSTTIGNPMFGNDKWGDCVMAARAHMTRRFEYFEQRKRLPITDAEVLNEYWKEEGSTAGGCLTSLLHKKPDNGLVILNSLNAWRKGWTAANNKYNIYAFSAINWLNHDEIYAAIAFLRGACIGVALPISAQKQDVWDVDNSTNGQPGSWGGHCVYLKAYDKTTGLITCVTWGDIKQMTQAFANRYLDEAYAVVDDRDKFVPNSPVDVPTLDNILKEITGG